MSQSSQEVYIEMTRVSKFWRLLRRFSLSFSIVLIWLLVTPFFPSLPSHTISCKALVLGQDYSWGFYSTLALGGIISFSALLRPRYLIVNASKGLIYYENAIVSTKSYYFVEVCGIQLETDMSQALLKLKDPKLFRLYLELHSKKRLLVCEYTCEEKINELAKKLQLIFKIEKIEHLQRVGGKKSKEMHLGNYAIQKELSHGGMGKVFIAQDKYTEQIVALKVLPIHLALNANYTTRFARETQILQKLSHPGIIKVIDVGRDSTNNGDVYFYAMEYIEGRPLSELIHEEGLSTQTAGQIVMEIALALDYIHQHGVVHRDVKPNNIMIRKDKSAVLIDFGIARDTSVRRRRYRGRYISTREEISHYVGTLPYMSPEQISSKHYIDYRTDIYSLGVTLYEALTQERPFKGSGQTISRSILNWYPPEPSKINGDIPHDLDIIVMRALEKSKKKRYENGAEFAEDLHRWLHEQPILSSRARWWIRAWRKIRGCFRWI